MTRYSDYFYASIPSFALAIPLTQIMPDLQFVQGIEKLGIVGILTLGMMFFLWERRHFMAKAAKSCRNSARLSGRRQRVRSAGVKGPPDRAGRRTRIPGNSKGISISDTIQVAAAS